MGTVEGETVGITEGSAVGFDGIAVGTAVGVLSIMKHVLLLLKSATCP